MPDGRFVRWLKARGWLASDEDSARFDSIDRDIDHATVCRCEYRDVDEGTDFVGGCAPHKAKPASTECEPHLHGYIRRNA